MRLRHRLIYLLGGVPNEHLEAVQAQPVVELKKGKLIEIKKTKARSVKSKEVMCDVTNKVCSVEPIAKARAEKFRSQGKYMRAYKCEFCPYWHLTHHKHFH